MLGLVGVAADWLNLAVFSLIVAESTVFCRLKFEFVLVWLLFVEVRGTAVGGPGQIRVDTGKCYNRILGIAQLHSFFNRNYILCMHHSMVFAWPERGR